MREPVWKKRMSILTLHHGPRSGGLGGLNRLRNRLTGPERRNALTGRRHRGQCTIHYTHTLRFHAEYVLKDRTWSLGWVWERYAVLLPCPFKAQGILGEDTLRKHCMFSGSVGSRRCSRQEKRTKTTFERGTRSLVPPELETLEVDWMKRAVVRPERQQRGAQAPVCQIPV